jgi:DNA-binding transcriptional ArsR family regulator
MWELVTSYRVLLQRRPALVYQPWADQVRSRVVALDLVLLPALIREPRVVPHFLLPPARANTDFAHDLSLLADVPASIIATELGYAFSEPWAPRDVDEVVSRPVRPLLESPEQAMEQLLSELAAYWRAALAPQWGHLEDFLYADIERTGRHVSFSTAAASNPAYSLSGDQLSVANAGGPPVVVSASDAGGLVASVFSVNSTSIVCTAPGIAWGTRWPMLPYVPRGFGEALNRESAAAGAAMAAVLGARRAELLTLLRMPQSTAEVSHALHISASAASQQLTLLHRAGLTERTRDGYSVRYSLSWRGRELLGVFAGLSQEPR